jgi:hypothetical protein
LTQLPTAKPNNRYRGLTQLRPPYRSTMTAIRVRQRLPKPATYVLQICTLPPFRDSSLHGSPLLIGTNSPVGMVLGLNCCLG